MKRVAIIGGGISGLAAAYRLSQSELALEEGLEIRVYEASERLGGVIATEARGGFLLERGPDAFISAKPWAADLCRELGLEDSLIGTSEEARQSFILSGGKLTAVPKGFYLMAPKRFWDLFRAPLLSIPGKLRMASECLIPRRAEEGDESVASFVRRRFGMEALVKIAQPMIAGIYAADPEDLSLEATFPVFLEWERAYGSVTNGLLRTKSRGMSEASGPRYSLFLTLQNGLGSLVSTLVKRMPNVHFHSSTPVLKLRQNARWELVLGGGQTVEADAVCLAIPAPRAADLLEELNAEGAAELREIPYQSVATVNLCCRRGDIKHPLNGAGFVAPAAEKKQIVGLTFASSKFKGRSPDPNFVLLRAFLGGYGSRPDLMTLSDEEMIRLVEGEIREPLGVKGSLAFGSVSRWPDSIPTYRVGHLQRVRKIFSSLESLPGLFLTGNAYSGPGVPDCIHHGMSTAANILKHFADSNKFALKP